MVKDVHLKNKSFHTRVFFTCIELGNDQRVNSRIYLGLRNDGQGREGG